ncbi:hypothetical protein [uncultured Maritimibacter sp.]|uniref:hypothetical protein n=1 Tax=uncultured Maritimibacter sp. TaxID=991866 RepID=UPI00263030A9|nr:hypothetical protein [uncultured Maritimibacter sp.]
MMKVTDIDIRDLRYDKRTACFRGAVSMCMETPGQAPKRVNFICQSYRDEDAPSSLITYDFVTHALDQARAMPGFRRGEEQIDVDIATRVSAIPFRAA